MKMVRNCGIQEIFVEGSTEWFNVQYDGEEGILTLNPYEDIENGDLDIVA